MHRFSLVLLTLLMITASGASRADVSLRWSASETPLSPLLASYLSKSNVIADFVGLVEENFIFEKPLILDLGDGEIPAYDIDTNTISMPYRYLERAVFTQSVLAENISEGSEEEDNAVERAIGVVEYTLYHLLAHSLVGNPHEAADATIEALSTYIVVAYWPDGADRWASAVEAFGRVSQRLDGPLVDYWHTHSLYKERQEVIRCWIRGSYDQSQPPSPVIRQEYCASQQRCNDSWSNLVEAVRSILVPQLVPDSTLGSALLIR